MAPVKGVGKEWVWSLLQPQRPPMLSTPLPSHSDPLLVADSSGKVCNFNRSYPTEAAVSLICLNGEKKNKWFKIKFVHAYVIF